MFMYLPYYHPVLKVQAWTKQYNLYHDVIFVQSVAGNASSIENDF